MADTADAAGIYRKYAAQVVAGRIFPRQLFFGRSWMLKYAALAGPREAREERRYMAENPHEPALREVFALAGVEYGRVDYAMRGGAPVIWEINSNPQLTGAAVAGRDFARLRVHEAFARDYRAALAAIDAPPGAERGAPVAIDPDPDLGRAPPPGRTLQGLGLRARRAIAQEAPGWLWWTDYRLLRKE